MDEKNQLRRIAELGITDFETAEDVECLQADMLDCLAASWLNPHRYVGLADCRADYCGRVNCLEACWFGTRRRRLQQIPAIYDLLQKSSQPLYQVRVVRGVWTRPAEDLPLVNIRTAKQLNRRLLEKVYNPTIVAVGMFNVFKAPDNLNPMREPGAPDFPDPLWICEIRQIVAGAGKHDLERIFSVPTNRDRGAILSRFWIKPVKNLGRAVSNVLRRDLYGKSRPWLGAGNPTKRDRREFYTWLLNLRPDARLIRYGSDQHFNKLEAKKPRTFRATVRKRRPYPYHLKRYMFGAREEYGEDKYDPNEGDDPHDVLITATARRAQRAAAARERFWRRGRLFRQK